MTSDLAMLEARISRDLDMIAYPEGQWVPEHAVDGQPVHDVVIIGAGQGGLAIGMALRHQQRIDNFFIADRAAPGREGPWLDYARMETLRTAKTVTGIDLGVPSQTFQAWYDATHGEGRFNTLSKIPKEDWAAYLVWLQQVHKLPVRNGWDLRDVTEKKGYLSLSFDTPDGPRGVLARKMVLANGIEGSGQWMMPDVIRALPAPLRAHTADPIDFAALRGRRVVVIGAGASAFDNAATALEAGAGTVTLLCRRPEIQRVQPYKIIAFPGFLDHFGTLPDSQRWGMMRYLLNVREALTLETWNRATIHDNFTLLTGAPVTQARACGDEAVLTTPRGDIMADFVITGTGLDINLHARPELHHVAPHVALWRDRYPAPPGEHDARLERYPYLGNGMEFLERTPGATPWINRIHCFNFGTTVSMGPCGSSISAMKYSVPRLARAIGRDLFAEDFLEHEARIRSYQTPEFPLTFARDLPQAGHRPVATVENP
ncbi:NAD(P)/FAD-dependent oxidoreductase [Komagataeibacter sp. AV436]|uniref:NAD(P)/FAD-dependent oxidoreductase n=1 Tax=Komagataeibacter melomenusus TaxID=2766578 RepID=A0ABX2AB44_9PROT|nr:NAD(P)/FAD-dependent oxidoreductase [Komagataeibacter melomenusus]MBV1830135.1 NAD(P)/FAD-dependent oxidoreductase [Komagataeibacter melomenusus]NPC65558.1 NAD(P)/FAD-dependent oxidoreductase [Komagataeibacter melomenusus]